MKQASQGAKAGSGEEKIVLVATNRAAYHDYHVLDKFECGMVLVGTEVKSLRAGHCQLVAAYARVDPVLPEVVVHSINIPEYKPAGVLNQHATQRPRKLLMHRREVMKLRDRLTEQGTTLIPLRIYFKNGRCKLELGLCKGKKSHDKRQAKRAQEAKREMARVVRR